MFVINPDPYSLPFYRIGPFQKSDAGFNHLLPEDHSALDYFRKRYKDKEFLLTINGRKAINIALGIYGLQKDDLATIITTSENFYISFCINIEIEKFCQWNGVISPEPKA